MIPVVDISELPDSIRSRIEVTPDCWIWTGARHPKGHGAVRFAGRVLGAHRLVYALLVGEIPQGLVLHHQCENKPCVNPAHLAVLTHKEHHAEHGPSGAAAVHAAKTACIKGHPFDRLIGHRRYCSICRKESARRWAQHHRASEKAKR